MDTQNQIVLQEKRGTLTLRHIRNYGLGPVFGAALVTSNANAAVTMPEIDVAVIVAYIALLVAAVATVGAAFLMVYLAAKGIKAIRAAF